MDRLGFVRDIHQIWDACLHPIAYFILSNPSTNLGIAVVRLQLTIYGCNQIQLISTTLSRHFFGVGEKKIPGLLASGTGLPDVGWAGIRYPSFLIGLSRVRGTTLASGAKSLVCKAGKQFVMFVLPADRKLSTPNV